MFFGPYKILDKIGAVAYKVELPVDSSIHPTCHVSRSRMSVQDPSRVSAHLSSFGKRLERVPVAILQRRLVKRVIVQPQRSWYFGVIPVKMMPHGNFFMIWCRNFLNAHLRTSVFRGRETWYREMSLRGWRMQRVKLARNEEWNGPGGRAYWANWSGEPKK